MEAVAERTGAQIVAAYCDGSALTMLASAGTPTAAGVLPAAIGQRLPAIAPIGISWMAFAEATQADAWLGAIESPELRARYRQALTQIRADGYCLGLETVRAAAEVVINSRPGLGGEPTLEERRLIGTLTPDPLAYVPSNDDRCTPAHPRTEVVSLWAPTFTPQGEVALGLMITGYPRDGRPPQVYADDLLQLTQDITALAVT